MMETYVEKMCDAIAWILKLKKVSKVFENHTWKTTN
jgi:hypothetical protein